MIEPQAKQARTLIFPTIVIIVHFWLCSSTSFINRLYVNWVIYYWILAVELFAITRMPNIIIQLSLVLYPCSLCSYMTLAAVLHHSVIEQSELSWIVNHVMWINLSVLVYINWHAPLYKACNLLFQDMPLFLNNGFNRTGYIHFHYHYHFDFLCNGMCNDHEHQSSQKRKDACLTNAIGYT